jgi:hypothetical protein
MPVSPRPAAAWKTSGGKVVVTSAGVASLVRRPLILGGRRPPSRLRAPERDLPAHSEIVLRVSTVR